MPPSRVGPDQAPSGAQVTSLLERAAGGDRLATNELFPIVYKELRTLADRHLAKEQSGHTLQPTALVNEAYLRLIGGGADGASPKWENRAHFFGAAARAIRQILTDHARTRDRLKRGGGEKKLSIEGVQVAGPDNAPAVDHLALNEALEKLAKQDAQMAMVVELRFYGGLTGQETARVLGVSEARVARDWQFARVWLHRELGAGGDS